jgi:(p)ppGpp synthase/HD superfamily hydrolase
MSIAILQQVQEFARRAHGDQRRKYADEPYIQHPVRVMDRCRAASDRLPMLAAALLHDVLEDTGVTKEQLADFLSSTMSEPDARDTFDIVVELTDVYTKPDFPQWNRRVRKDREKLRLAAISADAQTVKYADIIDNAKDIAGAGTEFAVKLLHEYKAILKLLDKGDPVLRAKAITGVEAHLEAVEK